MNNFFLITGPNGVGKSRFLEQYYEKVKDSKSDDEKILFMKSKENFNPVNRQLSISEGSEVFYRPNKEIIGKIFEAAKSEVCDKKFANKKLNSVEKLVKNEIVQTYNCDDFSSKKGEITETIIEKMKNTVKENVKPTDYLWSMCCGYSKLFDQYKSEAKNLSGFLALDLPKLEKLYNDQTQNQVSIAALSNIDKELLHKTMLKYAFEKCGVQTFAEEINKMLETIGYKYKLRVKPENDSFDTSLSFTLCQNQNNNQNNDTIKLEKIQLSSGESWILGVLMWQYTSNKCPNRIPTKFQKIILDEPDRHLDPILCRQFLDVVTKIFISEGIQVIMTTHRVDTVTLAPKDRIFKLPPGYNFNTKYKSGEEQLNSLQNSCKLEAIFRMTSNLREITNHHHKVYTEALDDAHFYESVYSFLRVYCSEVRQNARNNLVKEDDRFHWDINGKKIRILSERCQLSFYPASTAGNDQGGCEEVKKAVRRGQNFHGASKGPFDELALLIPYGILDNDYDKKHNFSSKGEVKIDITDYFVTFESRHSFENFLYDPFIIVSIHKYMSSQGKTDNFDECYQVLKNALDKKPVELRDVQLAANQCFYQLIKKEDKVDQALIKKKVDAEIDKSIKFKLELEPAKAYASSKLDQIFGFDIEKDLDKLITEICNRDAFSKDANVKEPDALYDIIKPQQIINRRIVEVYQRDALNKLGTQKIAVIIDNKESIEVEYPKLFLKWRGHELNCPVKSNKKNFKKTLLNNLQKMPQKTPLFVPMDLAKIFFDLSTKVRHHVREKIKPDNKKVANYEKSDN